MKKNFIMIVCFLFLYCFTTLNAQQTIYTNGYTTIGVNAYQTVNTNLFLTPASSTDPNPVKHFFTLLKRSYKVKDMFNAFGDTPTATPVVDAGLKMWKKKFTTGINANVVIIRPNDNISRPCILITPGVAADFSKNYTNLYMGAVDLAMRGYVVAFYEHSASLTFYLNNLSAVFAANLASDAYVNSHSEYAGLNNHFKEAMWPSYVGWQVSIALEQYLKINASSFNINSNWLFALGHSAGAGFSLQLAYAESGVNFTHEYYNPFKPDNRYCMNATAPITRDIKAVASIDGALREDGGLNPGFFGQMINANDSNVPALLMHGKNDNSVAYYGTTYNSPLNYTAGGAFGLTKEISSEGGKYQAIVNCEGGHMFGSIFNSQSFSGSGATATPNYTLHANQDDGGPIASTLPEPMLTSDLVSTSIYVQTNRNNFYKVFPYISEMQDAYFYVAKFFNERRSSFNTMVSFTKYTTSVATYQNQISTKFLAPLSNTKCVGLRQSNPDASTQTISSNPPLLYPNPTNGKLTVNFNLDAKINGYNVSIYSVDGRNVLSNTINEKIEAASTLSKDFDISDQPNGVYFIRITSENNVLVNEKFILNK
jgi:hypothetical protein